MVVAVVCGQQQQQQPKLRQIQFAEADTAGLCTPPRIYNQCDEIEQSTVQAGGGAAKVAFRWW